MTRPLRINYEGAVYHITTRGNSREKIFLSDEDREKYLSIFKKIISRFQWICYGYCLMDNHYHLIIETPLGNLSDGMRQLNGIYTQYFNSKYKRTGHLFEGRFKAILVEKGSYLLELCRYVVLNPVRAGICNKAEDYKWTNYRAFIGKDNVSKFMNNEWVLSQFGQNKESAMNFYEKFMEDGIKNKPLDEVKGQIYYGSDEFINKVKIDKKREMKEIPAIQRRPVKLSLDEILKKENGILIAYKEYGYKMNEIACHLNVHYATISRRIKKLEGQNV